MHLHSSESLQYHLRTGLNVKSMSITIAVMVVVLLQQQLTLLVILVVGTTLVV